MGTLKALGLRGWLLGAAAVLAAGCGQQALTWEEPDSYRVRQGDTLYSIAWRNGLDWRDVARWNHLPDGTLIYPGQVLKLSAPTGTSAVSAPSRPGPSPSSGTSPGSAARPPIARPTAVAVTGGWEWPARGKVLAGFGTPGSAGKGLDIGGRSGDPVRAAADGKVVYAGSGLIGYGKLIIVKHNDTFLSAYGHNRTILVREGVLVKAGQKIAEMGEGPGKKPLLHFEIRLDGEPVDPIRYLPKRN